MVCGDRWLDLSRTVVMGILNTTPDSFSDGGRFPGVDAALRHAESMHLQGADIIDIGGESTRPGSGRVTLHEELDRVIPVIEAVKQNIDAVISIDTSKTQVMKEALAAGAAVINDINALRAQGAMAVAAANGAPVCLMHMQGEPGTMQEDPEYNDVIAQVRDYLYARARECIAAGINREQIVIDPGFGFGKTASHNLELLRGMDNLGTDYTVMAGLSRKSMIGKLLGLPMERRVHASVALALLAVNKGARILRVHDVGPTVDAVRMYEAVYFE